MDAASKKLIGLLQKGLPLEKDPYGLLAAQLGITRAEVLERIQTLFADGYIRRLGGTFHTSGMGYTSVLFGMQVPEPVFDAVAAYVNACKSVTHNYRRSGMLNMWFTFSAAEPSEKARFLQTLQERFELAEIFEFPNLRNYKLHVFFDMESE